MNDYKTVIMHTEQDRIVDDFYVWLVKDKKTNLEGIFAMQDPDGSNMQAATSSPAIAKKIGDHIRALGFPGKEFTLI